MTIDRGNNRFADGGDSRRPGGNEICVVGFAKGEILHFFNVGASYVESATWQVQSGRFMTVGNAVPAKAFSLPVRTMALVLSSLSKFSSASFSSTNNAVDRALRALGRLRVTDRPLIRQQEA